MQINETLIRSVVEQVISQVRSQAAGSGLNLSGTSSANPARGHSGLFDNVDDAVASARSAFEQLQKRPIEDRKKIIDIIRRISISQCVELGTMEMEETKIGRLEHKIAKLKTLGEKTPGVEFLRTECYSGDRGLAVIEHAPFGVIGAITPVTHSLPTITGNAVSMIAGGNTLVVNPHPSGRKVAAEGVRRFNEAIRAEVGIDNCISLICEPTLETAQQLFKHRKIALICVTGGPAVARAALNSGKRAVVAGPK
jgi:aldehyde dehydrogenase